MNEKRPVSKCTLHINGTNYEFVYSQEMPREENTVFIFSIQVRDHAEPFFRKEYRDLNLAIETMQEMAARFQVEFPHDFSDIDPMELCNDNPPPTP